MAYPLPLLLSFLLFLASSETIGVISHVIDTRSLMPSDICSSSGGLGSEKTGLGLEKTRLRIIHRHSPCSPLDLPQTLSHEKLLLEDQSRVDSIHRRISTTSSQERTFDLLVASQIPAHDGSSLGTGNYIVSIGIGTPKKEFSVIFDTGSDVAWIQCEPCVVQCYPQQDPIFDPSKSSTYANISCGSSYCTDLYLHNCSASNCLYAVIYGDNSYTVGFFAQDTLTLTPYDVVPYFRFGCGENNDGLFGEAAGLLGLGRGKASLISQTFERYKGMFAYCLPAITNSTGYLTFGCAHPIPNVEFTPMLIDASKPTFYYLNLTGISVEGQLLAISPTIFSTAETIIDSGTVITRLPPDAYSVLRSAFKQQMSSYKPAPALQILDTCYDFTGYDNVTVPDIALHFSNDVIVTIDPSGIFYVANISQVCLGFAGNKDPTSLAIIGNVQQRKLNVVYDISSKVIGFGPGAC